MDNNIPQFKRQTAFILSIEDINKGKFVKEEDNPSYIITKDNLKVSKVNVMGIITNINSDIPTYERITIDDGDEIDVIAFDKDLIQDAEIGDTVNIIGRLREYNDEKYIIPIIIKKINPVWLKYRKKELIVLKNKYYKKIAETQEKEFESKNVQRDITAEVKVSNNVVNINDSLNQINIGAEKKSENIREEKKEINKIKENDVDENPVEKIYGLIKNLDKGNGVAIEDVITDSKIENAEEIIDMLIMEGEVFEIKPGILKVLE